MLMFTSSNNRKGQGAEKLRMRMLQDASGAKAWIRVGVGPER